ncbi:MAG: flagellar hook-length control protein FliK [Desulfovibrio sp.]|nr:flagellar hook-length control protein FliK [Desulfovibrio sp.]
MQILPSLSSVQSQSAQNKLQAVMAQSLQQYSTSFASSLDSAQAELGNLECLEASEAFNASEASVSESVSLDNESSHLECLEASEAFNASEAKVSESVSPDETLRVDEEPVTSQAAQGGTESTESKESSEDTEKRQVSQIASQAKPIIADVYSKHGRDRHTYTLEEMSFSQKECAELYNGLLADGAPAKALSELRKLTELPDGCTLGQVLHSLKGAKEELSLSDEDANDITALLDGIDPSGQLSSQILEHLYNGKPLDALRGVSAAIEELGDFESIEVSKQEVLAFGRGLGLDEQAMKKIQEMFGDQENVSLNPQGLKKALAPAEDQLLKEKSDQQKLDSALAKNLGPILNKAQERMQQEAASQNLKNRDADHSQTMIDRTVQKDSRQTLNKTLDAIQGEARETQAELSSLGRNRALAANFAEMGQQGAGNEMNNQQEGWNELFGKMSMSVNFEGLSQRNERAAMANQLSGQMTQDLSQRLVSQVENGLFSTLRNGASRLELQLHPQELGALTISLVARNGEVSAHIRADNAETVTLLSQQAELIKSHLEEQGVKVDSIEVELTEQRAQSEHEQQLLQDMEHHNSFQQEDARREQLRRLRNLANLENLKGGANSQELERSVHRHRETETSASRLLDRVA